MYDSEFKLIVYEVHTHALFTYLLTFLVCRCDNYLRYVDPCIISAEIIQGRKLFKGGNYKLLGGFNCGNYSREETIQGRKLFAEIRYIYLNNHVKAKIQINLLEFSCQNTDAKCK